MNNDQISGETFAILDAIQEMVDGSAVSQQRRQTEITPAYLGKPDGFFRGRVCGDFGCGRAVTGTINLLDLGAAQVIALDLDLAYVAPASAILSKNRDYVGRYRLDVGSLMSLPYPDETLDFVQARGIIHHIPDDDKGLAEVARVIKRGGTAYFTLTGGSGLIGRFVMEVIRGEYRDNPAFGSFVRDDLTVDAIHAQIDFLISGLDRSAKNYPAALTFLSSLKQLIDLDLIATIKDRAMAPIYRTYTEELIARKFAAAGFTSWKRVFSRRRYENIRQIVSPLYDQPAHLLTRMLFGEGGVFNFVAEKGP